MDIDVPAARQAVLPSQPDLPEASDYLAELIKIDDPPEAPEASEDEASEDEDSKGPFKLRWRFEDRNGRTWEWDHEVPTIDMPEIAVDLGLAGQTVSTEAMVGRRAIVKVRTFAGRKSAKIVDVAPAPAED